VTEHRGQLVCCAMHGGVIDRACCFEDDGRIGILEERSNVGALESAHGDEHGHANSGRGIGPGIQQRGHVTGPGQSHDSGMAKVGVFVGIFAKHLENRLQSRRIPQLANTQSGKETNPGGGVFQKCNQRLKRGWVGAVTQSPGSLGANLRVLILKQGQEWRRSGIDFPGRKMSGGIRENLGKTPEGMNASDLIGIVEGASGKRTNRLAAHGSQFELSLLSDPLVGMAEQGDAAGARSIRDAA
jgi:hypothetical protein